MAYHNNGIMVADVEELVEFWDFIKNEKCLLNPKEIPVFSSKVANWKCDKGHFWEEEVYKINERKHKCPYCANKKVWTGFNDLQTVNPKLAAEWDTELNKITPDKVSAIDTKKYWWKCKNNHPSFERSVNHRAERNDVCPYCSGRKPVQGVNDLETLHPDIALEWDYEANGSIKPNEVSANSWKEYGWICPKGHHYKMKVHLRTSGTKIIDCPKCVKANSTSFPEQAVYYYTKQLFPDAINRYKDLFENGMELDIYIPQWNIGIEYDGSVFHNSQEAKVREKKKYRICKNKNIKLIRIKEQERIDWFDEAADEVFYIKKRPKDTEMDNFLIGFFDKLTLFSHRHYMYIVNPITNKKEAVYSLPVDINIKRDRPKILNYLIDKEHSFGTLYPELASNWDYESNEHLTPYMLTPGSNYEVFFKCERCGGKWSAAISTVTKWNRKLCKKCSMKDNGKNWTKRSVIENGSLADKYKESVAQWDYERNGGLLPTEIPVNYSKEIFWKCPKCDYRWSEPPNARVHNDYFSACPHCSGRVAMPGVDDLETLYPEVASEWDFEKNKGFLPSQFRSHSNKQVFLICKIHKISYKTTISARVNGSGCRLCKGDKIKLKKGFKIKQFDKEWKYIKTYNSLNEAGKELKVSPESIRQAAINRRMTAGFYWEYEDNHYK